MRSHGTTANKSQHNFVFASWIVSTFGQQALRGLGRCVVDIAGGSGGLSYELSVRYGIECALIEAREASGVRLSSMDRRRMKRLCKWRSREASTPSIDRLQQDPLVMLLLREGISVQDDGFILPRVVNCLSEQTLPFEHIQIEFPLNFSSQECETGLLKLLCSSSLLVGMHADQATESIVDAALQLNLPFAVVPCCVFPSLFPDRKNPDGSTIISTEEFIDYLQRKDPSIMKCTLPFYGRNVVLYRVPVGPPIIHSFDHPACSAAPPGQE